MQAAEQSGEVWQIQLEEGQNKVEFKWDVRKSASKYLVYTYYEDVKPVLVDQITDRNIKLNVSDYANGHYTLYVGAVLEDGSVTWGDAQFVLIPYVAPTAEPAMKPVVDATLEPTAEPTVEPTAEPSEEPTTEPSTEPSAAATAESTAEVTAEPTAAVTAAPTAEATAASITETIPEPAPKPAPEPVPEAPAAEEAG